MARGGRAIMAAIQGDGHGTLSLDNDDLQDDLSAALEVIDAGTRKGGKNKAGHHAPEGFDPAAVFLLGLGYANLFEPVGGRTVSTTFRCKGCRAEVPQVKREQHYAKHKRDASKPLPRATPKPNPKESGDMTNEKTEKVSKTKLARAAAIAALKAAGKPMLMADIVAAASKDAAVKKAGVPDPTIRAQVNFELAEKSPVIVRVARGQYAHKDAKDKKPLVVEGAKVKKSTTAKRSPAKRAGAKKKVASKKSATATKKRATPKGSNKPSGSSKKDLAVPARPHPRSSPSN